LTSVTGRNWKNVQPKKKKSVKITVELYNPGFGRGSAILCKEEHCPFRKECANHHSAGDYRMDDGFSPTLDYVEGEFFCYTAEEKIDPQRSGGTFPENAYNLARGSLHLDENNKIATDDQHE
jgi:hypothetical protein